jgi:hypothetical protein
MRSKHFVDINAKVSHSAKPKIETMSSQDDALTESYFDMNAVGLILTNEF